MWIAAIVFLSAVIGGLAAGWIQRRRNWPVADRVFAREFALVDSNDQVRGIFGINSEGGVGFTFCDQAGTIRVGLNTQAAPGGDVILALADALGRPTAILAAEDGSAGLTLRDPESGQVRAAMGLCADGVSQIGVLDPAGQAVEFMSAKTVLKCPRREQGSEELKGHGEEAKAATT